MFQLVRRRDLGILIIRHLENLLEVRKHLSSFLGGLETTQQYPNRRRVTNLRLDRSIFDELW